MSVTLADSLCHLCRDWKLQKITFPVRKKPSLLNLACLKAWRVSQLLKRITVCTNVCITLTLTWKTENLQTFYCIYFLFTFFFRTSKLGALQAADAFFLVPGCVRDDAGCAGVDGVVGVEQESLVQTSGTLRAQAAVCRSVEGIHFKVA